MNLLLFHVDLSLVFWSQTKQKKDKLLFKGLHYGDATFKRNGDHAVTVIYNVRYMSYTSVRILISGC